MFKPQKPRKVSGLAVAGFIVSVLLCSLLTGVTAMNRANIEKLEMEQLISEKSARINEVISKLLYKTQALSALVIQGDGSVENFKRAAATLIDDPSILNVIIAPGGIVSDVYPLAGNETVIGLNYFGEGAGNKEALLARETGSLTFGGPFNLRQGGQAMVGRLPVYIHGPGEERRFWGLVSVTLKYPQALDRTGLELLEKQGYMYELWRISPETNEKQVIAASSVPLASHALYIEKAIRILNAEWYFRVAPVKLWHSYPETWILICAGFFISLLVGFVTQNNFELRIMKSEVEKVAQKDGLTGIFNRRHFMEASAASLERSRRLKTECFIILFDLDHFKAVNDTYSHMGGDMVLREAVARIRDALRPYDLFARYGGEEFIILAADITELNVKEMAERLRLRICEESFTWENSRFTMSASFGIAPLSPEYDIESAMRNADAALYKAKRAGRNRAEFYGEEKAL